MDLTTAVINLLVVCAVALGASLGGYGAHQLVSRWEEKE